MHVCSLIIFYLIGHVIFEMATGGMTKHPELILTEDDFDHVKNGKIVEALRFIFANKSGKMKNSFKKV